MNVHHRAQRAHRSRERSMAALGLVMASVFIALAGIMAAFYFAPDPMLLWAKRGGGGGPGRIEASFGDARFIFPETMVAAADRKLLGGVARIDLHLPWPPGDGAVAAGDYDAAYVVSLSPRSNIKTHEELLDPIYLVYLAPGGGGEGLTVRAFKPDAPYADSELAIDTSEDPPAVTRCDLAPSVLGPVMCERLVPIDGGLMARILFPRDHLEDWKAIEIEAVRVIGEARVK